METFNDVSEFMTACDHNERGIKSEQAQLYINLIKEEFNELMEAFEAGDIVGIADGCADLKWVVEGLEITTEIPQQTVWDEVYESNMTKVGPDGKAMKHPTTGKILKLGGVYRAPKIEKILQESGLIK